MTQSEELTTEEQRIQNALKRAEEIVRSRGYTPRGYLPVYEAQHWWGDSVLIRVANLPWGRDTVRITMSIFGVDHVKELHS